MDDQAHDQDWQDRYSFIATFPYAWLGKATELLDAANLALVRESEGPLKGTYRNLDIYMMLTAFALEDILKAIVLKRDPSIIDDENRRNKLFSGHDLCSLSKQTEINSTDEEIDLLRRLSQSVFGGRYPIPKDWVRYKGQSDGSGSVPPSVFKLPSDFLAIIGVVHKLEAELKRLGVNCDLYDLSYIFTKDDTSLVIKRRINPQS
jgi:hypothetical protein